MIFSKNLIRDLENNPSKLGLGLKIKDLVNIIEVANQQYFDEGASFLTDNTFDVLIDILKQRSPNNPLFKKIGGFFPFPIPGGVPVVTISPGFNVINLLK